MANKQQIILNHIANTPNGVSYTHIIKMAWEISYGFGTYTNENRGYWSGTFQNFYTHQGCGKTLLTKSPGKYGKYTLNEKGIAKLNYLNSK